MFEYVSFDEFAEQLGSRSRLTESEMAILYHNIKLPKRATKESAGYDFFSPISVTIPPGGRIIIPTGIKVNLGNIPKYTAQTGYFLALYPRSSYGFKYGMRLMNTVGIIDQDYYNNKTNEGHIIIAISTETELKLVAGEAFCQGIIQAYYKIPEEEEVTKTRDGGLGSTTEETTIMEHEIPKEEEKTTSTNEILTKEEVQALIDVLDDENSKENVEEFFSPKKSESVRNSLSSEEEEFLKAEKGKFPEDKENEDDEEPAPLFPSPIPLGPVPQEYADELHAN